MSLRVIITPNEDGNYPVVGGVVRDYFEGSADTEKNYTHTMIGFAIVNKGSATLTFEINGMTIPVDAGEAWDDCFEPFNTVTITATGEFKAVVRG